MNKYSKLTQNIIFKAPNIAVYSKKKNPKYLPIFICKKLSIKHLKKNNNYDAFKKLMISNGSDKDEEKILQKNHMVFIIKIQE